MLHLEHKTRQTMLVERATCTCVYHAHQTADFKGNWNPWYGQNCSCKTVRTKGTQCVVNGVETAIDPSYRAITTGQTLQYPHKNELLLALKSFISN